MQTWNSVAREYLGSVKDRNIRDDLDLRDWFAGLAMQSLLQRQDNTFMEIDFKVTSDEAVKKLNQLLSEDAYELADAMMEARDGDKE